MSQRTKERQLIRAQREVLNEANRSGVLGIFQEDTSLLAGAVDLVLDGSDPSIAINRLIYGDQLDAMGVIPIDVGTLTSRPNRYAVDREDMQHKGRDRIGATGRYSGAKTGRPDFGPGDDVLYDDSIDFLVDVEATKRTDGLNYDLATFGFRDIFERTFFVTAYGVDTLREGLDLYKSNRGLNKDKEAADSMDTADQRIAHAKNLVAVFETLRRYGSDKTRNLKGRGSLIDKMRQYYRTHDVQAEPDIRRSALQYIVDRYILGWKIPLPSVLGETIETSGIASKGPSANRR